MSRTGLDNLIEKLGDMERLLKLGKTELWAESEVEALRDARERLTIVRDWQQVVPCPRPHTEVKWDESGKEASTEVKG